MPRPPGATGARDLVVLGRQRGRLWNRLDDGSLAPRGRGGDDPLALVDPFHRSRCVAQQRLPGELADQSVHLEAVRALKVLDRLLRLRSEATVDRDRLACGYEVLLRPHDEVALGTDA